MGSIFIKNYWKLAKESHNTTPTWPRKWCCKSIPRSKSQESAYSHFSLPTASATPTIKDLINELKSVSWYSLGINLDLEVFQLNIIDSNHRGNEERCKAEMLSCWLYKQDTTHTWEAVAKALNLMGEYKVECVIREKYITPTATATTEGKFALQVTLRSILGLLIIWMYQPNCSMSNYLGGPLVPKCLCRY